MPGCTVIVCITATLLPKWWPVIKRAGMSKWHVFTTDMFPYMLLVKALHGVFGIFCKKKHITHNKWSFIQLNVLFFHNHLQNVTLIKEQLQLLFIVILTPYFKLHLHHRLLITSLVSRIICIMACHCIKFSASTVKLLIWLCCNECCFALSHISCFYSAWF